MRIVIIDDEDDRQLMNELAAPRFSNPTMAEMRRQRVAAMQIVHGNRCHHCGTLLAGDMRVLATTLDGKKLVIKCGACHEVNGNAVTISVGKSKSKSEEQKQ